jgi:putative flippase GtrA
LLKQYIKFLLNGGILGVVAFVLQSLLFGLFGQEGSLSYAVASAITYGCLLLLNFTVQRAFIFSSPGRLGRFVIANVLIMALVSALAPICRIVVGSVFGMDAGDAFGFIVAALLGATPSFVLSRYWIFNTTKQKFIP